MHYCLLAPIEQAEIEDRLQAIIDRFDREQGPHLRFLLRRALELFHEGKDAEALRWVASVVRVVPKYLPVEDRRL